MGTRLAGKLELTRYTRGGRSIFRIGRDFYVLNSRHITRANAEKSLAYKDSFYFGKTKSKIAKYGRYWIGQSTLLPKECLMNNLIGRSQAIVDQECLTGYNASSLTKCLMTGDNRLWAESDGYWKYGILSRIRWTIQHQPFAQSFGWSG